MWDKIFCWIRGVCACLAGVASYLYGSMNGLIIALFVAIVLDYVTGLVKAVILHKLSSEIGFKGILKKCLILLIVALAHVVDNCVGSGETWRNIAIVFYISNEGISIMENCIACGLPVPQKLKEILINMEHTTDEKGVEENGSQNDI